MRRPLPPEMAPLLRLFSRRPVCRFATPTLPERVLRRLDASAGPDACWRWLGGTARKRDGSLRPKVAQGPARGRTLSVARVILCMLDGSTLQSHAREEVRHVRCRNHWCINPRHLAWGTRTQNEGDKVAQAMADAVARGEL